MIYACCDRNTYTTEGWICESTLCYYPFKIIAKFQFIGALHTAKNADHIVATTTRRSRIVAMSFCEPRS